MNIKLIFFLISIVCCLAVSRAEQAPRKQLRIPLHKTPNQSDDSLSGFKRELDSIRKRQAIRSGFGRSHAPDAYIDYIVGSAYMANITVGTPPQNFTVRFSNAIANMFVTSAKCTANDCQKLRKYDSKESSTHKEDGRQFIWIDFWSHKMKGHFAFEDVQINGMKINQVPFGEIEDLVVYPHSNAVEGLFGLNFDHLSYYNFSTPIDGMVKQGLIDRRVYSIYWNESKTSPQGEIIFGEPDSDKGKVDYVVLERDSFEIGMDGISTNGSILIKGPIDIGFHPELRQHHGYKQEIRKLNYALGAQKADYIGHGVYEFDCNNLDQIPELAFHINGLKYVQKLSQIITYLHDSDGREYCMSNFIADNALPFIALGAPFIGPHYTVFDMDALKIGFVQ